jgi:hypothetical protein
MGRHRDRDAGEDQREGDEHHQPDRLRGPDLRQAVVEDRVVPEVEAEADAAEPREARVGAEVGGAPTGEPDEHRGEQ